MGWASGSSLLDEVARIVMPSIDKRNRPDVAADLIDAFRGEDCDTLDECDQPDIRQAWQKMLAGECPDEGEEAYREHTNPYD